MNNLFSCLWFSEVNLLTRRDQVSFGYLVNRLKYLFSFFLFPNCEYYFLFVLPRHTREHSFPVEWMKMLEKFRDNTTGLKETRGGLGFWIPYPGDLKTIVLPPVTRASPAR
ncbi:hypothetical protein GIB67_012303 [Kingdonia uniflora]|uniref:TOD1/MUCI70 glycosyltransferase-like domain-containing protein n=1 Tax=Kingdonia uniflora TaxID=39325 RepID=A0A7J7MVJ4_9MAGN|nr:hypothetical protein GIB67_012303 [Kingdonia uniflora]